MSEYVLDSATAEFAYTAAHLPPVYDLAPAEARATLENIQSGPVAKPNVDSTWMTVEGGSTEARIRIIKPVGTVGPLPVVLYLHGGGWVLGSAATHDRLVCELSAGADAAVVFVDYERAPELAYPVAIEQAYAAALWIHRGGAGADLDATRLAVAGDSAGGNLAAALTILAKQRGEVAFVHQSLYYPVTDAAQNTLSYRDFADGPHLTAKAMAWFWDAYLSDTARRNEILASPLQASIDELAGLPEAFVIVAEYDPLRDEGEAYAHKLTAAGVRCTCVRYNGTIHDFMMLNALRETGAASAAITQAIDVLNRALKSSPSRKEPATDLGRANRSERATAGWQHGAITEGATR
ncbi:esterase [Mycobacterium sp. 1164966.3]|uniref:alpha/beta hydrolase n=1 Tax=Mycobacterium sp. 1164966.3 TaxID=1856861 RepID=UPI0008019A21|nr:alpha/beta hydrolase [Mycobacterium sp. 1164966.3]OBA82023.1 esterase [Mycobacterium sp. 1164966.3]